MAVTTYFGFMLMTVLIDAVACYCSNAKFKLIPSLVVGAFWPASVVVVILIFRFVPEVFENRYKYEK